MFRQCAIVAHRQYTAAGDGACEDYAAKDDKSVDSDESLESSAAKYAR